MAFASDSEPDSPRPPISRHRAFPAVVALWFAALLGFGSMVLPAALLERGVAVTGIAAVVPAASPPLGFTARGLIALAAAVVGALAGVAIARRVARTHENDDPSHAVTFANGARRPIDVNEEIGGEGLASGFGQPITRRRALAIAEDDRPGEDLDTAPLADADEPYPAPAFYEPPPAPEATEPPFEPYVHFEDAPETRDRLEAADPGDTPPTSVSSDFEPLPPQQETGSRQEFSPAPARREAEPPPFAAPSMVRRPIEAEPSEPEPADPELAQLVHRLKTSLERRREGLAGAATTGAPPAPAAGFEPAPVDDAMQAMAAYFGRPADAAPPAADTAEADEEEADEPDGNYSSLLAMRGPYTPRDSGRVPVEEPEARDDPVEPASADTDAALRAALAKLQRMSGSA